MTSIYLSYINIVAITIIIIQKNSVVLHSSIYLSLNFKRKLSFLSIGISNTDYLIILNNSYLNNSYSNNSFFEQKLIAWMYLFITYSETF